MFGLLADFTISPSGVSVHGYTDILVPPQTRLYHTQRALAWDAQCIGWEEKGEGTTGGDRLVLAQCPKQYHKHGVFVCNGA